MKLSFIIPAYNEEAYIGKCLESILRHKTSDVLEIIVINNASTDTTRAVASGFPGVRVVDEPRKGLTRARQRGFAEAQGDLLAYVDADTVLPAGWLPIVREEWKKNPHLASLSGPYRYYDLPKNSRAIAALFWRFVAIPSYWIMGHMVLGGNFVVSREALTRIDGFDTTIEFYGEDMDLSVRLHTVGTVQWRHALFIFTSGRRLVGEGTIRMAAKYAVNVIWAVVFHRPFSKKYVDIR